MGTIEREPEVIDSLTSTSAIDALSANQGKVLNDKIPSLTTKNFTSSSFNAASATGGRVDIPIGLTGYIPIGIVRITGSSNSGMAYSDWYFGDNATAVIYYRNNGGDKTGVTLTITVLYWKG